MEMMKKCEKDFYEAKVERQLISGESYLQSRTRVVWGLIFNPSLAV
jgi:hypothetical protein